MKNYAEHRREGRRLTLLRLLHEAPSHQENSSVLHMAIDSWGFGCTRDEVQTDLHWLGEQGLVEVEDLHGAVLVARLTGRGQDVALGRAIVPGVARPRPR